MKRVFFVLTIYISFTLTGCATVNKMALSNSTEKVDTKEKSIVLMAIDVHRTDDSRFVPEPLVVYFQKPNAEVKEDHQNFKLNEANQVQEEGRTTYLASIALVPGDYNLVQIFGMANAFPINCSFVVPLQMNISVKPDSVIYVGRITAKLRKREDGEFRAGPVIPLIDQAICGMSVGTWDVSSENRSEQDISLFQNAFPALSAVDIKTIPLPSFDREAVQRAWGEPETVKAQQEAN